MVRGIRVEGAWSLVCRMAVCDELAVVTGGQPGDRQEHDPAQAQNETECETSLFAFLPALSRLRGASEGQNDAQQHGF